MEMPGVENLAVDEQKGVRYRVMAYRRLGEDEVVMCIRMYLGQKRRKKPKRGDEITIVTILGHDE
jgi:hypothetical protein